MKNDDLTIDIKPESNVYAVFSRMSYETTYAIAEFVDNSTANYYENKEILETAYGRQNHDYKLKIQILNDTTYKSMPRIIIQDNALGMEIDQLKVAMRLGNINFTPKKNSRNEYGMGMKTAAIWFSRYWTVETSKFGSSQKYKVDFDVDNMKDNRPDTLNIEKSEAKPGQHFTKITLNKLNKPIRQPQQKQKLVSMLTSMYRRDISTGKIEIIYADKKAPEKYYDINGTEYSSYQEVPPLKYEEPEIYKLRDNENEKWALNKIAKKEISSSFIFEGIKYSYKGFIAVREKGSASEAGIALMRRGRVVVGGRDKNYKPREIFGAPNSFQFQRLFGEFDLDEFPVNQAKDNFSWDDGLEDAFLADLIIQTKEVAHFAQRIRKVVDTKLPEIKEKDHREIEEKYKMAIEEVLSKTFDDNSANVKTVTRKDEVEDLFRDDIEFENYQPDVYTVNGKKIYIKTMIGNKKDPENWIDLEYQNEVDSENTSAYTVVINVEHSVFKPYSLETDFFKFFIFFSRSYVASIVISKMKSIDQKVDPWELMNALNKILNKYDEETENGNIRK